MFDPAAITARELLAHFGKNTAIRIDHKYGQNELRVISARTGNIIATVTVSQGNHSTVYSVSNVTTSSLEEVARVIQGQRNFPKPRNMKRSWSPIRLSEKAVKMMEADSGIRFA